MVTNILEYLEKTVAWLPEKTAFRDESELLRFRELYERARSVGTYLLKRGSERRPVVVFMKRSPSVIAAYFGVVYAGCYYVPVDAEMPQVRLLRILERVQPEEILCDSSTAPRLRDTAFAERCCRYDRAIREKADGEALARVRSAQTDTDPVYVVFTSGSTGEPKGVIACHRNVVDYIEALAPILRSSSDSVFGNQAPLSFDACLKDVMCTVRDGGTCVILPKGLFSFPLRLVEALNRYGVNTICWAASALTIVSSRNTFSRVRPQYLHTVAFAGEAFPTRQLALWRSALPGARFVNLYGPTECTGTSCYYIVDRAFSPEEAIPIGRPFPNTGVLLLDENGAEANFGEICIRGSCLTLGYFRDPERTAAAFVSNPASPDFPERIYRTGDYGTRNDRGELVFLGRKDAQIKYMGHRIELGEIEAAAASHPAVRFVCCQFEEKTGSIQLFFTGDCSCREMTDWLKERLPGYMLPKGLYLLEFMPLTPSGKIDRTLLRSNSRKGVYAYEATE